MGTVREAASFRPASLAGGPHAQTLVARVRRSAQGPEFRRERIETADGDFVDLDWGPEPEADAPVVLILHGLEGSSRRRYVRNVARELFARGVRPVGLNFRGCSGEPNRTLRFYHSGETGDATRVLELIRVRFPGRPVGALGFSLGGNVLLKLLGERDDGGRPLVRAAVAMSVPYDLAAGCRLLERSSMGRIYTAYFLRSLKRKVADKAVRLADVLDVEAARRSRTIWDFDERVTSPLHGFEGAADYYARSSSKGFLGGIGVPTLLIHAEDDPFLPPTAIPIDEAAANPHLTLSLQPRGGHVGFLAGSILRPVFWGDELAARFLAERLGSPP